MSKFKVNYYKPKDINLSLLTEQYNQTKEQNVDDSYNPYEITKLQLYNPLYKLFFDMNENNYF